MGQQDERFHRSRYKALQEQRAGRERPQHEGLKNPEGFLKEAALSWTLKKNEFHGTEMQGKGRLRG